MADAKATTTKYRPSTEEKKKVEKLESRMGEMKKAKDDQNLEGDWNKWDTLYFPRKIYRKDAKDWQSKLHNPQVFAYVNTSVSMLIDQRPEAILEARSREAQPKEPVLKGLYDYTWEKGRGDVELYYVLMSAGIYGTGIAFEGYRSDVREIKEAKRDEEGKLVRTKAGKIEYDKNTIKEFDDVYWRNVDIRNFYIDEMATNMQDARDCAERFVYDLDTFKFKYPEKRYSKAKHVKPGGDTEEKSEKKYHIDVGRDRIEVWHYYNKVEDSFQIWANGIIIKDSPIPYHHKQLPYIRMPFYPRSRSSFWAMGLAEILENHSDQLDTIINMRIDQAKLNIYRGFMVGGGELIDEEDLRLKPSFLLEVNDINNVVELKSNDIKPSAYKEDGLIMESMKYATGIDPRMEAISQGGTATEAAIVKESSLRRIKIVLRLLEKEFLANLATMRIANIQQFYSIPRKVNKVIGESGVEKYESEYREVRMKLKKVDVDGETRYRKTEKDNFFEVTPDDIRGNFDVKIRPMSTIPVSKALEDQQFADFFIRHAGNPHIDMRKLTEEDLKRKGLPMDMLAEDSAEGQGMIVLAEQENMQMAQTGEPIPPTEGATPEHTAVHEAFMQSDQFKQVPPQIQQAFQEHVSGEKGAQTGGYNEQGTLPKDFMKSPQRVNPAEGMGAPNTNRAQM